MVPVVDLSRRATAEAWARECVTVPCFPEMTDDEIALAAASLGSLRA